MIHYDHPSVPLHLKALAEHMIAKDARHGLSRAKEKVSCMWHKVCKEMKLGGRRRQILVDSSAPERRVRMIQ